MLSGDRPHPVTFLNHKSFYDNWGFSSGEATKLVGWGAASVVKCKEKMPIVIHPLGVAFTGGKGRLIVNSRYANLFMKLLPFRYERLRDILGFTKQDFFMSNWDLKSGYYHVPIHPKYRKYFGIKIGDTVLHSSTSSSLGTPRRAMCSQKSCRSPASSSKRQLSRSPIM